MKTEKVTADLTIWYVESVSDDKFVNFLVSAQCERERDELIEEALVALEKKDHLDRMSHAELRDAETGGDEASSVAKPTYQVDYIAGVKPAKRTLALDFSAVADGRYSIPDNVRMALTSKGSDLDLVQSGPIRGRVSIKPKAEITVYSGEGCQQCVATRRSLDQAGIEYKKVSINEDPAAGDRLRAAGQRTLPVVEVDGEIKWSGFRPDLIDDLIAARKR